MHEVTFTDIRTEGCTIWSQITRPLRGYQAQSSWSRELEQREGCLKAVKKWATGMMSELRRLSQVQLSVPMRTVMGPPLLVWGGTAPGSFDPSQAERRVDPSQAERRAAHLVFMLGIVAMTTVAWPCSYSGLFMLWWRHEEARQGLNIHGGWVSECSQNVKKKKNIVQKWTRTRQNIK